MNEIAAKYRSLGLSVMPIGESKRPMVAWTEAQKSIVEYDFDTAQSVGLICGAVSGNLEAIDFDLKYDLSGDLMKRYRKEVEDICPDLVKRLLIQKTPSGGYHFIYRCAVIGKNTKLAQREANEEEKAKGERVKVLIETRGEGGYIGIYPSQGYERINGSIEAIPIISEQEREVLIGTAIRFNSVFKHVEQHTPREFTGTAKSPIEDYNERADPILLLESYGWKVVGTKGQKVHMRRPGDTSALTSGNWDIDKGWFSVFSTSTEFEPQRAYKPFDIYHTLTKNRSVSDSVRELVAMGYGEKREVVKKEEKEPIRAVSIVELDYLVSREDFQQELDDYAAGRLILGRSTGIHTLDPYFRLKKSHVNIVNGFDNVGKTTMLLYIAQLSSCLYGDKWGMFIGENTARNYISTLLQLYYGERVQHMNSMKIKQGVDRIMSHFFFLKSDRVWNYQEILEASENLRAKHGISQFLIDPWNNLATVGGQKVNKHDHDHQALTEITVHSKQTEMTYFINTHSVTASYRNKDANGNLEAPNKGDTEGGTKFASKASDFMTFHRKVQDSTEFRKMEIHVRKVKDTDTGGRPTPFVEPVILEMHDGCKYLESTGRDPMAEWRGRDTQVKITANTSFLKPKPYELPEDDPNYVPF